MIEIRTAHGRDIPAIDTLLARSYPRLLKDHYPPSVLVTAIPRITRAQPALVTSGTYYVGAVGGQVVAAGGWTHRAPGSGGDPSARRSHGHMRHFATDPDYVRQGIGRALGEHVLTEARAAGVREIEAVSTLMAVPYYEALGFTQQRAGAVTLAAGITLDVVFLTRRL